MHPAESELRPMLAYSSSEIFDSPDYIYEVLWEGVRCLASLGAQGTLLQNRRGENITWRYPELADLHQQLLVRESLIDGEIVVLEGGLPSQERLRIREQASDACGSRSLASEMPALFVAFDLLRVNEHDIVDLTLLERKRLLRGSIKQSRLMVLGSWVDEKGRAFLNQTSRLGIEGVMAKEKQSHYLIGQRSPLWLKIRRHNVQDCVICGFTEGLGRRSGSLGSLVLGAYWEDHLIHVGQVGSGFTDATLKGLTRQLEQIETDNCPFDGKPEIERRTRWVRPCIVCEVEYSSWTAEKKLRSARFVQLRAGKKPEDCQIEDIALAVKSS